MKIIRKMFLAFSLICVAGCGTFWAGIADLDCPYSGVQLDFATLTNSELLLGPTIFLAPFIIVDLPLSLIWDTARLGETYEKNCKSFCFR